MRIDEFDTWRPGYGLATVRVYLAGTTTLASLFSDEDLTVAADNPQTLAERVVENVSYGKFNAPVYVGVPYSLLINSIDETGVERPPLVSLDGEDASDATVQVTGGTEDHTLADHLARRIDVRDFGDFLAVGTTGASAATNQATLAAAIAASTAAGGGIVEAPGGTYQFTGGLTIPEGVVIEGRDRVATTLQSTLAGNVIVIGGARAGLAHLTLDGVTLVAGSVGLYAANKDEIVVDDVEVKRFESGISRKGGTRCAWRELYISNCVNGYMPYGDAAAGAGGALRFNTWRGGKVELCSTVGMDLRYVDQATEHNQFQAITFDTNTAKAVWLRGVRYTQLIDCRWIGNTNNLTVEDATPATTANTVAGLEVSGGEMVGGTIAMSGDLDLVAFLRVALSNVTVTLSSPQNNILVEDCPESGVTIAGEITAWRRTRTQNRNASAIVTTDDTPTKSWAITLQPGEHVYLVARSISRQRNGENYRFDHSQSPARRPGATLAYDTQTGNFTLGQTLTGATSGATGRIVADTDVGVSGVLTLHDIVGVFIGGEIITDGSGGSATTIGGLTFRDAQIMSQHALDYDAQTANFTVGQTLTGATSGASGRIVTDTDAGASGSLRLDLVSGIFVDNEIITDGAGGSATANGFNTSSNDDVVPALESVAAWSSNWYAIGAEIQYRLSGVAGQTIDHVTDVDVLRLPQQ